MTETETVIRTIKCPLETSDRKNEKLKRGVEDFRKAAKVAAEVIPSFAEQTWTRNNGQIYRTVKTQMDEYEIKDKVVQNAVHRVTGNYQSVRELGNDYPKDGIPSCDFVILTNQGYDIAENDRGYGFKGKFIYRDPEWWHMDIGDYQREYLERAIDGDARLGQVELAYNDGNPVVRIAVTWEQEVTDGSDAEYIVGVDVGLRALYAAAVRDCESGEIVDVDVQTGNEFHHRRKAIQRRLTRFKQNGKIDRANNLRRKERRYTDQTMHEAANSVVDLAREHMPCIIRVEDLTNSREKIDDPMHNWPFNDFQEKVKEKAAEEGIGVVVDEPYYTSQTCRECGYQDEQNRDELQFVCLNCGYEVNADANAAMNLAQGDTV